MKPINLIIGLLSLAYACINAKAQTPTDTVKVIYKGKSYTTGTKREADEEERTKTWKFRDTIKKEMVLVKVIIKDDDNKNWDTEESGTRKDSTYWHFGSFRKGLAGDDKLIKTYFLPTVEYGFLTTIKENDIDDKLDPVVGKSEFYSINWIRQTINLSHNKFFLSYGFNQNYNTVRYSNKQQIVYLDNNGYLKTAIDTINHYKKNSYTANYLTIPVLFEYHSKNKKFKIAAGAEFGFNGRSVNFQKGSRKEGNFTQTNRYDMKLNPIQINTVFKVQVEHIALFARYSVTDMYKSSAYAANTNPNHHLFSVGICVFGI